MAIDHEHGNGERNPGVEYDKSDLSAKGILIFFFVLAVSAIAIHLIVLALYVGMTKIAEKHEPEVSPLAPQTYTPRSGIMTNTANVNAKQFPQPRLLTHVRGPGRPGEMSKFLDWETAVLTASPWRDAQGNVHLPIDQAMKIVLSRLPVREGGAEVPNYPGVGRRYSYPTAPWEAPAEPSPAVQGNVMQGEGKTSSASNEAGPRPLRGERE